MALLVKNRLEKLGAKVKLIMVDDGPPVIYGEIGEEKRTLLFHNHYDVVPPEPIELWKSEPFEPQMREGKLYARGVADDKGDLLSRIQAIEAYQATIGELPIKIKFVFEGMEEVGSPQMEKFAAE
jgi:acetylornithine deacetylase/succinyl-diaminopimelate desuccinylase-like protein